MSDTKEMLTRYESIYPTLNQIAGSLELHLKEALYDISRIDSIRARAKEPDRFLIKALKEAEGGERKYKKPFFEIQDQIGARVTVFYLSDVDYVREAVKKLYKHIEMIDKAPSNDSEFGYVGVHFILKLPDDVCPDECDGVPEFFELQIKTLFQHAWSEAHHDLGYKPDRELTSEERRKIAFTAAQSWGADKIFEELFQAINDNEDSRDSACSAEAPDIGA